MKKLVLAFILVISTGAWAQGLGNCTGEHLKACEAGIKAAKDMKVEGEISFEKISRVSQDWVEENCESMAEFEKLEAQIAFQESFLAASGATIRKEKQQSKVKVELTLWPEDM